MIGLILHITHPALLPSHRSLTFPDDRFENDQPRLDFSVPLPPRIVIWFLRTRIGIIPGSWRNIIWGKGELGCDRFSNAESAGRSYTHIPTTAAQSIIRLVGQWQIPPIVKCNVSPEVQDLGVGEEERRRGGGGGGGGGRGS